MTTTTTKPKGSYWHGTGRFQKLYSQLHELIPNEGPCRKGQPHLEKLRVASNCYYDLYNNGLWNRAGEFEKVFGFVLDGVEDNSVDFEDWLLNARVDALMDVLILNAAVEQGCADPPQPDPAKSE